MRRREMMRSCVAGAAVAAMGAAWGDRAWSVDQASGDSEKFKLGYAPHPGMFKNSAGSDVIDQINFAADQGFTAFEYNGLPDQSPQMQERIGRTLAARGMQMGVFVA